MTRQDKTRQAQDKTRQDKTKQHMTIQDKTKQAQDKTRQDNSTDMKKDKIRSHKTRQGKAQGKANVCYRLIEIGHPS